MLLWRNGNKYCSKTMPIVLEWNDQQSNIRAMFGCSRSFGHVVLLFFWVRNLVFSVVVYRLFSSVRYLAQTHPVVQDEGEAGRLCGRMPGGKGHRSWRSRSAPPLFCPSYFSVFFWIRHWVFTQKGRKERWDRTTTRSPRHSQWRPMSQQLLSFRRHYESLSPV